MDGKRNLLVLAMIGGSATGALSIWFPIVSRIAMFGCLFGISVFFYDRYRRFPRFRGYRGSVVIGIAAGSIIFSQIPVVWAQQISLRDYGLRCLMVVAVAGYAYISKRLLQQAFGERPSCGSIRR